MYAYPLIPAFRPVDPFKSNVRETWRVILVSEADIFLSESLRILAERLSQSETHLPLRQICYYSLPKEVGVFSTEIKRLLFSFPGMKFLQQLLDLDRRRQSSPNGNIMVKGVYNGGQIFTHIRLQIPLPLHQLLWTVI